MPEGHKTHWLAQDHALRFSGQSLKVSSPQGRFTQAKQVSGRRLQSCWAAGKHLFYEFEGDRIVHVHLGRYGSFALQSAPPLPPKGQVRMRWIGDSQTLDLRGPMQCRLIDRQTQTEICQSLGPDPLAGGKRSEAWKKVSSSSKPIGVLLLDQSVIAGVGNIFRAEVLFEIGMNPFVPGDQLTSSQFAVLWKSLSKLMRVSLQQGRIVSVTAREAGKSLAKLSDNERFRIYAKSTCPRCGSEVESPKVASRKLFHCPQCQPQ